MNGLFLSPLGPALLLLLASILLRIVASPRRSSTLALLTLLPLALTLALLLVLRNAPGVQVLQTSWWPVVVAPLDVLWALDGWNWLSLVLLTLVTATAVLLTWRLPGKRAGAVHGLSFLFASAAALTVVSDNLLTLSGAWIATDMTLLAVGRARGAQPGSDSAPIWLEITSSMLVMVAIGITSFRQASGTFAAVSLPPETVALLLLAAGIRMAAYPLHLWLAPNSVNRDGGTQLLISAGGLITGGWLLGRLAVLGAATWLADPVWLPVLTVLMLAGGLAAWLSRDHDRFHLLGSARGVWMWLMIAAAPIALSREALGWALAATVLSLMLFAVGSAIRDHWNWHLPLLLAAVAMAGVPLTVGMPAYALASPGNAAIYLLWLVANGLAVACIFVANRQVKLPLQPATASVAAPASEPARVNWPVIRLLSALAICLIPIALWGIQTAAFARSAGFGVTSSLLNLVGQLGLFGLLGVAATLALGWGLAQVLRVGSAATLVWHTRAGYALGLAWLLHAGRWLFVWIEIGGRTAFHVVEGEGYLGWVLLLMIAAGLIFLR